MSNSGKYGEQLFKQIVESGSYLVKDVSGDPDYWRKDIDFIVTSATGAVRTYEVKWDSRINSTNNLYLELTNVNSKQWGGEGWWLHCKADYLAYGDAAAEIFYIIPLVELRQRVKQISCRRTSCGNDSTGLLLSLKDIADIVKVL